MQTGTAHPMSKLVHLRSYARWIPEKGRRELTWKETTDRYCDWISSRRELPDGLIDDVRREISDMNVMPSMRAAWAAGASADRDNTNIYNCAFMVIDNLRAFSEGLYILMCGTGLGFSVEREFVNCLPVIANKTGETVQLVVQDTTEGWADAVYASVVSLWRGHDVKLDVSQVRLRGAILKTKGGRASGPEPLVSLIDLIRKIVDNARGRRIRPIEAHDIMCAIGNIVRVGGVRRSALISISDRDDEEMRHAKDWSYGAFPDIRYMSNNSARYKSIPTREEFDIEWNALRQSGSGERGIFHVPSSKKFRGEHVGVNPCGEILLRYLRAKDPWTGEGGGGQFCNLTAAVMRATDTLETMKEKVRLATWLGAIQASFTYFPYLRPGWQQLCEEDRLLGVDITGQCDNPALSQNPEVMLALNKVARETATIAAKHLGINDPAAVTCGKPSGNTSAMAGCASGFHPHMFKQGLRRVRIDNKDPLFKIMRDVGVPMHKDNGHEHESDEECSSWVVEFPLKAPDGAMIRNDETAIQMLTRYLHIMDTWCGEKGHNQSITVYIRDYEWDDVGDFVYKNLDKITGVSFLPYDGGKYRLAPYEELTIEEYEKRVQEFPEIPFDLLPVYEDEDMGEGAKEYACTGGNCEI